MSRNVIADQLGLHNPVVTEDVDLAWRTFGATEVTSSPPLEVKRFVQRPFTHRSVLFLPGFASTSAEGQQLNHDVATHLERHFPAKEATDGLYESGDMTRSGLYLLNAQGVFSSFAGGPPLDAASDLRNTWAQAHAPAKREFSRTGKMPEGLMSLLDRVLSAIWADSVEPSSFSLKRGSNSGAPWFKRDLATKLGLLLSLSRNEDIGNLIMTDNWRKLTALGFSPFFVTGYRTQLDSVTRNSQGVLEPKERAQPDFLGNVRVQDKTIPDQYNHGVPVFCARSRPIMMGPMANLVLVPWAKAMERGMYDRVPGMTIRGDAHLSSFVARSKYVSIIDISQMDQNMPPDAVTRLHLNFGRRTSSFAGKLASDSFLFPVIVHNDTPGKKGICMRTSVTGNRSGSALTSLYAKAYGVYAAVATLIVAGLTEQEALDVVTGKSMRATGIFAGDNIAISFSNEEDYVAYRKALAFCPVADLEETETILGKVLIRSSSGPQAQQDLTSFWFSTFGADHSIQTVSSTNRFIDQVSRQGFPPSGVPSRMFWGAGLLNKLDHVYPGLPGGNEMIEMIDSIVKKHSGRTLREMASHQAEAAAPLAEFVLSHGTAMNFDAGEANTHLFKFMDEPSRIAWDPNVQNLNIPEGILSLFTNVVDINDGRYSDFWRLVRYE